MARTSLHFVQITTLGWIRFDTLMAWNGTAARLWTRLARSIDGQGVVVSTAVALAADLGVSVATVRRHLTHLETVRAFVRFRLPGGLTAFAMNPNEVWSGKPAARTRAPYCTGVLGGDVRGQAALRRGSWFLPGIDLLPSKPKKDATRTESTTGDLFAALDAHAPVQNIPEDTTPAPQASTPQAPDHPRAEDTTNARQHVPTTDTTPPPACAQEAKPLSTHSAYPSAVGHPSGVAENTTARHKPTSARPTPRISQRPAADVEGHRARTANFPHRSSIIVPLSDTRPHVRTPAPDWAEQT